MADLADLAQALEERHRARALARARAARGAAAGGPDAPRASLAPRPAREATDPWCRLCGELIPEARRRAVPGVTTCVGCQSRLDAGRRR